MSASSRQRLVKELYREMSLVDYQGDDEATSQGLELDQKNVLRERNPQPSIVSAMIVG